MSLATLSTLSGAARRRRAPRSDPQPSQQVRKLNVLLVDDDPADSSLILSVLVRHPNVASTQAVDSPVYALRQLAAGYRKPDLVLLDIHMLRIDGLEFLKGLRRIAGMTSVPVVFLTTSGMGKDILENMGGSAPLHVIKPDTLAELKVRLDGVVERAISGVWSR